MGVGKGFEAVAAGAYMAQMGVKGTMQGVEMVGGGVEVLGGVVSVGVEVGAELAKPVVKGVVATGVEGVRGAATGAVSGAIKGAVEGLAGGAEQGAKAGGIAGLLAGSCGGFLIGALRGAIAGAVAGSVLRVSRQIHKITELHNYKTDSLHDGELRALGSAFVSFADLRSAIVAAKVQLTADVDSLVVTRCPEPRDIFWLNLGMPLKLRDLRKHVIWGVSLAMVATWMLPVTLVSSLANLDNVAKAFPFVGAYVSEHPLSKGVIEGFLPSLVLALFMNQLPDLLAVLSQMEGTHAHSLIDAAVLSKFFYFQVFNVFLGVTVSAGSLAIVKELLERPVSIVLILGTSVPKAASFFVNYVCFQSLATFPIELFQLETILMTCAKYNMAVSARDRRAALVPDHFKYGENLPKHLLVFLVACVYSVINPLILPLAALFFGLGWAVMKHKFLYVHMQLYEGEGAVWSKLVARIVASLIIFHLTFIGILVLKATLVPAFLAVPLPVFTIYCYRMWIHQFLGPADFLPIDMCCDDTVAAAAAAAAAAEAAAAAASATAAAAESVEDAEAGSGGAAGEGVGGGGVHAAGREGGVRADSVEGAPLVSVRSTSRSPDMTRTNRSSDTGFLIPAIPSRSPDTESRYTESGSSAGSNISKSRCLLKGERDGGGQSGEECDDKDKSEAGDASSSTCNTASGSLDAKLAKIVRKMKKSLKSQRSVRSTEMQTLGAGAGGREGVCGEVRLRVGGLVVIGESGGLEPAIIPEIEELETTVSADTVGEGQEEEKKLNQEVSTAALTYGVYAHGGIKVYGDKGEDMFLPPSLAAPLAFLEVGNVWGEDEEDEEEEMGGLRRLAGMFGQY